MLRLSSGIIIRCSSPALSSGRSSRTPRKPKLSPMVRHFTARGHAGSLDGPRGGALHAVSGAAEEQHDEE